MFKHKSIKSTIIVLVAVLMVATVMFAACDGAFTPVTMPPQGDISSNGGNAVRYGNYLYYVNGYQSSASAENTYVNVEARVGAIARILISDLADIFKVSKDEVKYPSSSARTTEIAKLVAAKSEIVIPKFYYSGNTTTTQLNGIYIFDDRLYVLTPNDELTAGGNSQSSQNVLTSFKMDGSDQKRHYVFTNNAAQIMLDKINGELVATYIMGNEIGCVSVVSGKLIGNAITETSSAQFDVADKSVVYLDGDGSICKLSAGATERKVLVENKKDDNNNKIITYTISSVNAGYVYYTMANSTNSSVDGVHLYYATETVKGEVALKTSTPSTYYGYKGTIVYSLSEDVQGTTLYGIYVLNNNDGSSKKIIVNPVENDNSITFNRLEGDTLYYTSNNIAYKVNLNDDTPTSFAIGKSLASASGWSVPDFVDIDGTHYIVTLSSGSVSVVEFDAESKDNVSSVTLTKVATTEDKD